MKLMLHRCTVVLIIAAVLGVNARGFCENRNDGFQVRDAATAIKIAKAAFEQDFGKAELKKLKYFEASLEGDRWTVRAHPYKAGRMPSHGGSFDFTIAAKGGCILSIIAEM